MMPMTMTLRPEQYTRLPGVASTRLRSSPHRHAPPCLLSRNPTARLTGAPTCFRQDAGIPECAGVEVCLDLGVVLGGVDRRVLMIGGAHHDTD